MKTNKENGTSRRGFLRQIGSVGVTAAVTPTLISVMNGQQETIENESERFLEISEISQIKAKINGKTMQFIVDNRTTILDLLREELDLIGTKKGCNHGACGACTVHIDGKNANSCLQLAALCDGKEITTIEGLEKEGALHPIQEAFLEHDGYQCGYCTSGQIMTAITVAKEGHASNKEEIRELMSGNLCRCGAYNGICDAIDDVIKNAKTL